MNFELRHMRAHKIQKNTILGHDSKLQKIEPWQTRINNYMKRGFMSYITDLQSMIFFALFVSAFIFWIICQLTKEKEDEVDSTTTDVIDIDDSTTV